MKKHYNTKEAMAFFKKWERTKEGKEIVMSAFLGWVKELDYKHTIVKPAYTRKNGVHVHPSFELSKIERKIVVPEAITFNEAPLEELETETTTCDVTDLMPTDMVDKSEPSVEVVEIPQSGGITVKSTNKFKTRSKRPSSSIEVEEVISIDDVLEETEQADKRRAGFKPRRKQTVIEDEPEVKEMEELFRTGGASDTSTKFGRDTNLAEAISEEIMGLNYNVAVNFLIRKGGYEKRNYPRIMKEALDVELNFHPHMNLKEECEPIKYYKLVGHSVFQAAAMDARGMFFGNKDVEEDYVEVLLEGMEWYTSNVDATADLTEEYRAVAAMATGYTVLRGIESKTVQNQLAKWDDSFLNDKEVHRMMKDFDALLCAWLGMKKGYSFLSDIPKFFSAMTFYNMCALNQGK